MYVTFLYIPSHFYIKLLIKFCTGPIQLKSFHRFYYTHSTLKLPCETFGTAYPDVSFKRVLVLVPLVSCVDGSSVKAAITISINKQCLRVCRFTLALLLVQDLCVHGLAC